MKSSLEKLRKFFRLEADRGYDDKAVMGGLGKMLESWQAEAQAEALPQGLIEAVVTRLRDYRRLSPDSRAETLKGLWNRIKREVGEDDGQDLPSVPSKKPQAEATPEPAQAQEDPPESPTPPAAPPKPKSKPSPRPRPEGPSAALEAAVTVLDGVGPKNAEKLSVLGIQNLADMLYHFPRRYDDYTQLKPINKLGYDQEVTVIGTVQASGVRPIKGGKVKLVEVIINDGTGALRASWFNQPWLAKTLKEGTQVVFSGKIEQYLGRLVMNSPEWELLVQESLHTNRIVPIYPLTAQITQRWLRKMMDKVVKYWALRVIDPLPESVRKAANLVDLPEALLQIHFPDSQEDLVTARRRLAFDEIFLLQLGVAQQKQALAAKSAHIFSTSDTWIAEQTARLPFKLTNAQLRALETIRTDLGSGHPMNRLLQGDVGSGKTVVAGLGIQMVVENGPQAAIMAPTGILADQHYRSLSDLLAGEGGPLKPEQIRLMVGATPESEKQAIRESLQNGQIKLIIGTHALLEDPVIFQDLQLIIIDEQHRFGVEQRATLREKGQSPHLLVMTATPIPRSLALTIYGDLDLSIMDEMPPGRLPVETHTLLPRERERAYTLIGSQIEAGNQAFIIYPLVEESDHSDSPAAVEEHKRLQEEVFIRRTVGLLHGRMKPAEKDSVMNQFRNGEFDILVSTTVVEVGVDIPNATVMLVEGANRFGLAQLHQLRGRVGRGQEKAYCLLVPEKDEQVENERLQVMSETNDGFELAERDLEQRGPGQFFGRQQSGFGGLQLAALSNVRLIETAREQAQDFIAKDPNLEKPEHEPLARILALYLESGKGDIS